MLLSYFDGGEETMRSVTRRASVAVGLALAFCAALGFSSGLTGGRDAVPRGDRSLRLGIFVPDRHRRSTRRQRSPVRRPAGWGDPHHRKRRHPRDAVPDVDRVDDPRRRRTRAPVARVSSELRGQRLLLRLLHARRRRRADDRPIHAIRGRSAARQPGVRPSPPQHSPCGRRQPQRRQAAVRSGRLPLQHARRRRERE